MTAEAFDCLYREHWSGIFNYARFRLGPSEAQDAAADVFTRAWARREQFDPLVGTGSAWLWAVARNSVVDRLRRPDPPHVELTPYVAAQGSLAEGVAQAEELQRVVRMMGALAAQDQEIIALRFGAGLTNREIAPMLGLTDGNVALRLHRALRRLRQDLERDATP